MSETTNNTEVSGPLRDWPGPGTRNNSGPPSN